VQLADPLGQCRGTGLQDVGGLDLVYMIGPNRLHPGPILAPANLLLIDLPSAPGSNHDVRIGRRYLRGRDDPAGGGLLFPQARKDRLSAGHLEQLIHPAYATNQRIIPLLEEDPWPPWELSGSVGDLRE